jgi:formamidopyrimidine-DNA glycosylase
MCNIYSHGKKILISLENGTTIANELIMTGHWSLKPTKYTKLSFCYTKNGSTHSLYFNSIRNFSKTIVLFTDTDKHIYFSKLGPDILKNNISKEDWVNRFRKMTIKRKGSKPYLICDALLDQSIFSGIGNYLRADIMYDAGICPYKPCQELTDQEYEKLRISAHKLIRRSYESNGFTIQNYHDVDGSPGKYRSLVYNQKKCPKGHEVVKERFLSSKFPKRTVHWVPKVQK